MKTINKHCLLTYLAIFAASIIFTQSCAKIPSVDEQTVDLNISEELFPELTPAKKIIEAETPLPLECIVSYDPTTALNQFAISDNISQAHRDTLTNSLTTSLNFMYCLLGEPIVKKKIIIEIDNQRPDLIAVTQWQLGASVRKIVINPKELEARAIFERTLVHELVHALYQNDRFFINNRDFIIEGMASYFENYYRFGMNKEKAMDYLQDRIKAIVEALGMCLDVSEASLASDVNKDFDEFGRNQVDVMYNLSAYYWFALGAGKETYAGDEILRILGTYTDEPAEHILNNKKAFSLSGFERWYGIDFDLLSHLPIEPKYTDVLCVSS